MPFDPRTPFTRATGLANDLTDGDLRSRRFRTVFTGVYIAAEVAPHPLHLVQAAPAIHPNSAFASHTSAGRVYGVPLPDHLCEEHVSVFAKADRRRRRGIRNHVADADTPVVELRGIRVSSVPQMFVELADCLNLVDLVVVGDWLVRWKKVTLEELRRYVESARHPGALRAVGFVRERVDSPMETRLRMLLVLAGLPEPEVDHKIYDALGRLLYRFDLAYPDLRIALEYDGRQHRADLEQWDVDSDRRDWCERNDWAQVPVFSRGLYRRPDKTIGRVRERLEARGARLGRPSEEWRRYFPVKP